MAHLVPLETWKRDIPKVELDVSANNSDYLRDGFEEREGMFEVGRVAG